MPDEDYIWNKNHVDIILKDVDTNPVVMEKKITLFFKNLDIGGVGSGNVKRLIQAKYDTIPKILAMEEKEYLNVEGFKAKLANKVYTNIKTQEIPFFITKKDENSFPKFHEILMVNAAIKKGISQDLTKKWQDQLQEAELKGNFAFTVISVLTSAFSN